jgi:LuxR family maltose regulon positive regulatory protein
VSPAAVSLSAVSHQGVPSLPHALVRRSRLEERFRDPERRQITLVSGLPGAGKTTLVASWLRSCDRQAAWVSLGSRHDEPGRLTRAVVRVLADVGAVPEPRGRRRRSDATLLDSAFDLVTGERWVLVLDDVHELRSSEALAALRLLLDRAPATLSLVLCARADPPVALGRLRLDGRLGEIRNADLEFTQDETADLLAGHGIDLRRDEVRALWRRTQGWVAGLRLAAGALAGAGDPHELVRSTAATEAAIADYLLEEVLDRQDPDIQSFLLRTSVVEDLTPDLAALLAGDPRAQERLDDLQRSGVFLTDAAQDGWYRYHALFAALLRAGLRRRQPEAVGELHGWAAAWLVHNGRPIDAERHARLGGNWALAGHLAADRWLAAVLDDGRLPPDLLVTAPDDAVGHTPALSLVAAATACARRDRAAADLHRRRLDELAGPPPTVDGLGIGDAHRHTLDLAYGWTFGADERARAAAHRLAAAGDADPRADAPSLRRLGHLRGAELDVDTGQFDAAVAALNPLADSLDDDWMCTEAAGVLAVVHAANGNVAAADRRAGEVMASGDVRDIRPTALQAAYLATALHRAQRGERRNAAAHLHEAEAIAGVSSRPLHAVREVLRSALGESGPSAVWLDTTTAAHPLAAQALIACGVFEVIDPQRRLLAIGGQREAAVARARQELGRGAPDAARIGLARGLDARGSWAHPRTVIESHTLAAIACSRCDDDADAQRHLRTALDLVAGSGVRAPLLDHGPAIAELLGRESTAADHRGLALELLDHLRRTPGGTAAPVDGLTDRETAVLQYLPTLMSNAEIAQGLHLSINTVKSHLKAVYRKLGVDGRREAVLRGRELELI